MFPSVKPDTAFVSGQRFREAMSLLAAPITIVTTRDDQGVRWGFTASAVTSVSLEPPLVLVGVGHSSSCHPTIVRSGEFVINVLAGDHRDLASRFATQNIDRFDGSPFTDLPGTALPCLPDAHLLLRCTTWQVVPAGDHDLLIGAVVDVTLNATESGSVPLLWHQRGFQTTS